MKKEIKEQDLNKVTGGTIIVGVNTRDPNGMTTPTPPIPREGLENTQAAHHTENFDNNKNN